MLHLLATVHGRSTQASLVELDYFSTPPHTLNVGIQDKNGEAALHIAAKHCCSGFSPYFINEFETNPCSEEPLWNPVIALVETFATPINIRTAGEVTPLQLACKIGLPRFVEYLLDKGADARAYDALGRTTLH